MRAERAKDPDERKPRLFESKACLYPECNLAVVLKSDLSQASVARDACSLTLPCVVT